VAATCTRTHATSGKSVAARFITRASSAGAISDADTRGGVVAAAGLTPINTTRHRVIPQEHKGDNPEEALRRVPLIWCHMMVEVGSPYGIRTRAATLAASNAPDAALFRPAACALASLPTRQTSTAGRAEIPHVRSLPTNGTVAALRKVRLRTRIRTWRADFGTQSWANFVEDERLALHNVSRS